MPPHLLFIRQMSCGLLAGWSGPRDPSVVSSWGAVPEWEAMTVLGGGGEGGILGIVGLDGAASIWMMPPARAVGSDERPCPMAPVPAGD